MLTLTNIIDYIMVNSGNYIIQSFDKTLLNKTQLWNSIVLPELGKFSSYKPYSREEIVDVPGGGSGGRLDFRTLPGVTPDNEDFKIPIVISRCTYKAATIYEPDNIAIPGISTNSGFFVSKVRSDKWVYNRPYLLTKVAGLYSVQANYVHEYKVTRDVDGISVLEVEIPTMSLTSTTFLSMVLAKFYIALGRSRRAFTINDMPITMDADAMITEGTEMYSSTMESLYTRSTSFVIAWRD